MPTIPVPITIICRPDGIDVNPTRVNVGNNTTQQRQLKWTVVGSTFPTSNCFSWKNSPTGAPTVSCPTSSGQTVLTSDAYTNNFDPGRVWQYAITIVDPNNSSQTITIDPEINNEPPGT